MMDLTEQMKTVLARAVELGAPLEKAQKRAPLPTADERLIASFESVNQFVEQHGRPPGMSGPMAEKMLFFRLDGIRKDHGKCAALRDYDRLHLLPAVSEDGGDMGIFDVSGLPQTKQKPDYIARRRPCKNFALYAHLFAPCQADLAANRRHYVKLRGGQKGNPLRVGSFVLANRQLGYVAQMGDEVTIQSSQENRRLLVVYENGTESDLLMRSLYSTLYEEGNYLVSEPDTAPLPLGQDPTLPDGPCLYVLRTLGKDPQLLKYKDLCKIGVTEESLAQRLANAEKEPTYLMAGVRCIASYTPAGGKLDLRILERTIHHFFSAAALDLTIRDSHGHLHHPKEWYDIPLSAIEHALSLIPGGDLPHYRYDTRLRAVVRSGMN